MSTLEDKSLWEKADEEGLEELGQEILKSSTEDINNRTRLLDNEIKVIIIVIIVISMLINREIDYLTDNYC